MATAYVSDLAAYTLQELHTINSEPEGSVLVVIDTRVYDITEWLLNHEEGSEQAIAEVTEIRNLAVSDFGGPHAAGQRWALVCKGDDRDDFTVGELISVEEKANRSKYKDGKCEDLLRWAWSPPLSPNVDSVDGPSPPLPSPYSSFPPGKSHLTIAMKLLAERKVRYEAAQRRHAVTTGELRKAQDEVEEAERIKDYLLWQAGEGIRPKWHGWE